MADRRRAAGGEVVDGVLFYHVVASTDVEGVAVRTPAGTRAPGWGSRGRRENSDGTFATAIPEAEGAVNRRGEEGGFALERKVGGGTSCGRVVGWWCGEGFVVVFIIVVIVVVIAVGEAVGDGFSGSVAGGAGGRG